MKSEFITYLDLGFKHISDIGAYDHILFIIALCAIYKLSEWRKVLILVTAFTIGHSVTLALAALKIISIPSDIIEFLIPVTIFITSIYNTFKKDRENEDSLFNKKININYFFALFFGLIHGMGFSNFFRSLLGQETNIVKPLFAFNLGLEAGQVIIVSFILFASFIAFNFARIKKKDWILFISGMTGGISLILMMETKFW